MTYWEKIFSKYRTNYLSEASVTAKKEENSTNVKQQKIKKNK